MENQNIGLLKVDVKSPQIIAGEKTIVNLLIRNPFPNSITIESIEAPNSSLLKEDNRFVSTFKKIFNRELKEQTSKIVKQSIKVQPLTASFIQEVSHDLLDSKDPKPTLPNKRLIESGQEDIASFEIETADWLLTKPTTVELYAVIKYTINDQYKSQIIPIVLQIQPPVKSIISGSILGGVLGHTVRELTSKTPEVNISLLAVFIMSIIVAIILAKRENSNKGFITLEDFSGAFFIGVMIGYMGTEYFDSILKGVAGKDVDINITH